MATSDLNSMPQNINNGFRDKSIPDPILINKQYPTHLPLWLSFMQRGPLDRQLAGTVVAEQLYGAKSFEEGSPYYTHVTDFIKQIGATGNQAIFQRIVAENAAAAAMRLWFDVLPTQIPLYERGTDGKYILDTTGRPKPTGETTPGYKIQIVKTVIDEAHGGAFGQASQMDGNQTDPDTLVQSRRYPFQDIPVSSVGKYGNDLGIRQWAPTAGSRTPVDAEMIEDNKAYPYIISCLDRANDTVRTLQTTAGTQEITCVFKRNQVKVSVGRQVMSYEDRFFAMYNDRKRKGIAPLYGPFDQVHLYYENLETILKLFYAAEVPFIDEFSDFTGEGEDEIHRFNFLGGRSSRGVPYHSFLFDRSSAGTEAMSDISTSWAEGGADGDTDLDTLNRLVGVEMAKYGDINEQVTEDRLGNPESFFYDSGFGSETKMILANFIAVRKDTFLVYCLRDAQAPRPYTADEESSLQIALFTRVQMMPESVDYGTPAARVLITACDGSLINEQGKKRLPLALEIGVKSAEYMGAANGLWKTAFRFSHGQRANVTMFKDVNVTWRPLAARQRDWANGMVYVQKKDMEDLFFPALQTAYAVKNSIFTSYFTTLVFVDLAKVSDRVWSQYSGADQYSNEQFKKYVEAEAYRQIEGKYDSRVQVVFTVVFTAVDEYNGFSWSLMVDVGADTMKTVQKTLLTGYRRESMPAAI